MSGDNKGFSFRQLFFRDSEPNEPVKQNQTAEHSTNMTTQVAVGIQEQPLVENFVERLQNLINQNNQPGFDFLEFTETLFEEKQNPSPEVYKTVFRIAQKMDKSLTPSRLLDSSMYYKNLVQQTAEAEIAKGESKKQVLKSEKETERNNLDSGLKDTRTKIQQLNQQIQSLQNDEMTLNKQLMAIDQKYEGQFTDIDKKIGAIRNAKEQVIVSIVDIEAGIKSNL